LVNQSSQPASTKSLGDLKEIKPISPFRPSTLPPTMDQQKPAEDGQSSAIQEFVEILEEHRKNCEQQGKYVEAEIAKNRLIELRAHEDSRQREFMKARHISEKLGVEEAHMLEFRQFNAQWDKKLQEYDGNAQGLLDAMKERHAKELQEFQAKTLGKQQFPKFSPALLNCRRIEEHLVKAGDYNEAHKVKMKADAMEKIELQKWEAKHQHEMTRAEAQFKTAKRQEVAALQKRIQAGKEEQKKQRRIALERLLQRYNNIKAELDAAHTLECQTSDRRMSVQRLAAQQNDAQQRLKNRKASAASASASAR